MSTEYKPAEGEMTRPQLFELLVRVRHMKSAMQSLLEFVEREKIGMSHGFCDKYPFGQSFDELFYEVLVWEMEIEGKHLDSIQAEEDFYMGNEVVK